MLFLLRKVRRMLMERNKVTTYFLYALGEIFLVVIGILIAVSIDNWNQERQNRQLEIKYLKEIKANLEYDLQDINFNIEFNESRSNSNHIVLNHLRSGYAYHDSLDFHLSNLVFSTRTLPKTSTYESLKSRGLELITNDSLRFEITRMYSFSYHNAIDFETQDDHPFQFDILWPEVIKAIEIDSLSKSAKPINYDDLQKNIAFKNALTSNLSFRKVMLRTYIGLHNQVSSLIKFIDEELNRLEN